MTTDYAEQYRARQDRLTALAGQLLAAPRDADGPLSVPVETDPKPAPPPDDPAPAGEPGAEPPRPRMRPNRAQGVAVDAVPQAPTSARDAIRRAVGDMLATGKPQSLLGGL